jgi:hypothetical protein
VGGQNCIKVFLQNRKARFLQVTGLLNSYVRRSKCYEHECIAWLVLLGYSTQRGVVCQALSLRSSKSFPLRTNLDMRGPTPGLPIGAEMRRLLIARPATYRSFSTHVPKYQKLSLPYQRHGSPSSSPAGPPIILMHGLFGSHRNNRTMSK